VRCPTSREAYIAWTGAIAGCAAGHLLVLTNHLDYNAFSRNLPPRTVAKVSS
jgi:hypothetical protein